METQVTAFGKELYCVVFRLVADRPQIIDTYIADDTPDLEDWLAANGHQKPTEVFQARAGASPAPGFYIKPFATDRYFMVLEGDRIEEMTPVPFEASLGTCAGFDLKP
jgi:hypothetical protein